jgi:hypothetical protein
VLSGGLPVESSGDPHQSRIITMPAHAVAHPMLANVPMMNLSDAPVPCPALSSG